MKLEIKQLTRIEGHANLVVDLASGTLQECRLEIVETPRFFESFLKGQHFTDVAAIVARICGICSNSHTLASLAASEQALGISVSNQTLALRRLLAYGEILQSHLLQLIFMAMPDYLGVASIMALAHSHRDLVTRALRLKKLASDMCRLIGGRAIHPVTPCLGGFSRLPESGDLQGMRKQLVDILPTLEQMVELFADFRFPEFDRPTEYLCLKEDDMYPLLSGRLCSSAGISGEVGEYRSLIEEYLVPYSTAKFARSLADSYMVGPLARYKNAGNELSPMALAVADALGISRAVVNPFTAMKVRLVEVVNCCEASIHLIDRLLLEGLNHEPLPAPGQFGEGIAAIEAPRGTLIHHYRYDDQGRITMANCIIPTAQNLANIENDLKALVPRLLGLPRAEMAQQLQMLIRAYDPCISCSTHALQVSFV